MYYNEERKKHYIDSLNGVNESIPVYVFKITKKTEEYYEKDICDFVPEEIEGMLYTLKSKSIAFIKIFMALFADYTEFCIRNNYRKISNINYFELLNGDAETFDRYIDKDFRERRYILPNELVDIMAVHFINEIDKVMFQMLWEGFGGEKMSNLRLLKHSDVDYQNKKIKIINGEGKSEGEKHVSDRLLSYIKESKHETHYMPNIGEDTKFKKSFIVGSDYVFKPMDTKRSGDTIGSATIYGRYNNLINKLDMNYTKVGTIGTSNLLYLALLLKYVGANSEKNEPKMYRLLGSLYHMYIIDSGMFVKYKIEYNYKNTELTKDDIDKDIINTYIKNIDLLKKQEDRAGLHAYMTEIQGVLKDIIDNN